MYTNSKYEFNYPVVILYTNHYVGAEDNPSYLATNKEQLHQALKQIALDNKEFDEKEFNKIYKTDNFSTLCDLIC